MKPSSTAALRIVESSPWIWWTVLRDRSSLSVLTKALASVGVSDPIARSPSTGWMRVRR
jgi:hypothetical protein